jgi:uncharacterized repeat protein (TIGR01451 family)
MSIIRRLLSLIALCVACLAVPAAGQTVRVSNTATLRFLGDDGAVRTVASNTVGFDTTRAKQPTTLRFYRPPPDYTMTGMECRTSPGFAFTPAPIDAATLARSVQVKTLDVYSDMVLVLENPAGNHDAAERETATINASVGTTSVKIPLRETGPDTGVFAGGVPATATGKHPELRPCDGRAVRGVRISLSFDEDAESLASSHSLLIDPAGFVFDSRTGVPVDGAIVSLVDANGQPATVFGDDGVSRYPSTVTSGGTVTDAGGTVYPALRGRYRFPLTLPGVYHLVVQPPGDYTAPSVVPLATLERLTDPAGQRFILNDASFGRALTLSTPDPFYADIPVDRPDDARLLLTKTASVRDAVPGDLVQYRLRLTNRGARTAAAGITDHLPPGLRYTTGSTRGTAEPVVAADGRTLTFPLAPLPAGATAEISYIVTIAPAAPVGEAVNHAQATGDGVSSNDAAASVRLRPLPFIDALTILGRVTEGDCGDPVARRKGVAGVRLMLEDGSFAVTDRDGLYHFEGVPAGRHVVQLDRAGIPVSHVPVACDADTRQAGSAISRFVEAGGGLVKRVDFQLKPTGRTVTADPLPVAVADDAVAAGNRDWLAVATPGTDWLFPAAGHNPRAPAQRVVVKHDPAERVTLTIDGVAVDPLAFDGTDRADAVAVSRWTGIPLHEGDNRLVATVRGRDGQVVRTLDRIVHYAGAATLATFESKHSRLLADGLSRPLLAVRVVDRDGRPVRAGTPVPFQVDQPYRAAPPVTGEQALARTAAGTGTSEQVAAVVGDDGLAFLPLAPTTQAGAVHAIVTLADERRTHRSEIRTWLTAPARDWMVVGFGAGSLGYDTLRTRASALPRATRGAMVRDGQLALYASGRIRGSWLLTMAYDSDRRVDPTRGITDVIDPTRYYTVYGDAAVQGYDAATRRKLYLRLERREAYALFGDIRTGFTDTQLTRYSRTLTGAKAAYEGRTLRATGFVANVDTRYARDEIQGNGLTGPYRLSQRGIVPNTDRLHLEVRDRFRSERILSTVPLTRHIDYEIDIRLGTVRFRDPVLSRDTGLNPRFIVAEYEVEGTSAAARAAGARIAGRTGDGRVEIGATLIRDETLGAAMVGGADLRARLGGTELRGELAGGGRHGLADGLAWLAEAEHHGAGLDLLLYARQQDTRFGVGQQNLVEAGTRKLGIDTRLRLAPRLDLTAIGWYQAQLIGAGERIAGDARLEYRRAAGTVFAGAQIARDRGLDGRDRNSLLLTLGGTQALNDRLSLSGQTQFAPGGARASVDFPARQQLTASWRATDAVRLIAGYERADGRDFATNTVQLGFDLTPWRGGKLTSTLNDQATGVAGRRTYAQYGLAQSVPLGGGWSVEATIDAADTVRGAVPVTGAINAFQPAASGGYLSATQVNGDYRAVTLGVAWRAARWAWNARLERRDATAEDRSGFTANLLRTLGGGGTVAGGVRSWQVTDRTGARSMQTDADLALALRPFDSRWSILERLELHRERAAAVTTAQTSDRIVNNLALNYRTGPEGAGHGLEATLHHGIRYIRGRFTGDTYTGLIDVTGFELRHDIGHRFDIGVQASVQHSWSGRGAWAWSGGPSLGVSPAGNLWLTAGYNIAGYRDRDAGADRYTRKGPYVTMRIKVDQDGARAAVAAAQRMLGIGR